MPTAHKILMFIGKRKYRAFIRKKKVVQTITLQPLDHFKIGKTKNQNAVGFIKKRENVPK